jgi:hypothetical protein
MFPAWRKERTQTDIHSISRNKSRIDWLQIWTSTAWSRCWGSTLCNCVVFSLSLSVSYRTSLLSALFPIVMRKRTILAADPSKSGTKRIEAIGGYLQWWIQLTTNRVDYSSPSTWTNGKSGKIETHSIRSLITLFLNTLDQNKREPSPSLQIYSHHLRVARMMWQVERKESRRRSKLMNRVIE